MFVYHKIVIFRIKKYLSGRAMRKMVNETKHTPNHIHKFIKKTCQRMILEKTKDNALTFILWNKHLNIRRNVLIKI